MSVQWYYTHAGVTQGPVSEEEIADRVAQKLLFPTDLIWPVGKERKDAAPASAILDFASAPSTPAPDWLADVAKAEAKGPQNAPLPNDELPEWLDDLRLWVGLELYQPAASTIPTQAGQIPEWLEGWLTPPKPKATPPPPPVSAPPKPAPANEKETLSPPARPTPALPIPAPPQASPAAPAPVTQPASTASIPLAMPVIVPPTPATLTVPVAAPVAGPPPVRSAPIIVATPVVSAPVHVPANPVAQRLRELSGFDLETGQILDAAKFKAWKQQQAQPSSAGQPAVSNASLFEVFRKGRIAIETWVDDDKNRIAIMYPDIKAIRNLPAIQAILEEYAKYGQAIQDKLLRHLEFMVENRNRYYKAIGSRTGSL